MIDATVIRAHQQRSWGSKKNGNQALGRSVGGPTTKIHLICNSHGNPLKFSLTEGQVHDVQAAPKLLEQVDEYNPSHMDMILTHSEKK